MNDAYPRLRITLSLEVDRELVEAERVRALEEDPELENFYGRPWEWGPTTSILDIFDAQSEGVIVRSEVVSVEEAPAPYEPPAGPGWLRRLLTRLFPFLAVLALMGAATAAIAGAQTASTGYERCAVVDPYANKVIEVRQGSGDTIVRVIGYVDHGDTADFEADVWNFAAKLVTNVSGTTLRERCVTS